MSDPASPTLAPVSPADAAAIAQRRYGLTATAEPLPGEYDHNFRLTAADGALYVLKVMHAGAAPELVDLQIQALAHLARRAPELALPRVVPALDGALVTAWDRGAGGPGGAGRRGHGETGTQLALWDDVVVDTPRLATAPPSDARLVWMLTYVPGALLANVRPHTGELLGSLGRLLARVDQALEDFAHPAAGRPLKWDLRQGGWIADQLDQIADPARRAIAGRALARFTEALPLLDRARRGPVHGDANDYNVLVGGEPWAAREAVSLIDFGDMHLGGPVCELAISAAYALLDKPDPVGAIAAVAAGYHAEHPLREDEIALIFPLVGMRLAVSVTNSAIRKAQAPDDPYITISEAPAWAALGRLDAVHPRLAHYRLRAACGLAPVPGEAAVVGWLLQQANGKRQTAPWPGVLMPQHAASLRAHEFPLTALDLSVGSLLLGANPAGLGAARMGELIFGQMREAGAAVGVGGYNEPRLIYAADAFGQGHPTEERRTIHLGVDLWAAPDTPIYAPLPGIVHTVANNDARLDYGPLVILEHRTDDGTAFYTLYGHCSLATLSVVAEGQAVAEGDLIGYIGAPPTNGDWPPHLHFQIILDLLDLGRDFPGVALASQRPVWLSLSPDPNLILGLPEAIFPPPAPPKAATLAARRALLGRNLSISYRTPLKIVAGWRQYLYDETGRAYLDVYNNVPHVGHSHPRVVRAAQAQLALLNTNTRYLHDNIVRYAERLTGLMPEPLRVCYFVNSASEANELAMRLARAYTGRRDMIVLDAAYHGHTTGLIDISPYKFAGPGGTGKPDWVHVAPIPDDYRGPYTRNDPQAGMKYAQTVAEVIAAMPAGRLAGFIAESLPSVGGQIVLPPGYLAEVYRHVRAAGGVCIADEVQVGFGRLGEAFWGFELQSAVPDIVVLGKPIGNGFPLGRW